VSDNSAIEWTDATWNPVTGCTEVSPGCDHCYAKTLHERFHGKGSFSVVVRSDEKLFVPFKWRNSMSDLFHDDVPGGFIANVFSVIARTPQHTYQLLTKRQGRMRSLLNRKSFRTTIQDISGAPWPLPNLWLGVSVEDQKWANVRIPALLDTPAAVRFISAEPLLGPIDLHARDTRVFQPQWLPAKAYGVNAPDQTAGDGSSIGDLYKSMYGPNLDWVIVGGESGPPCSPDRPGMGAADARPMHRERRAVLLQAVGRPHAEGQRPRARRPGLGRIPDDTTGRCSVKALYGGRGFEPSDPINPALIAEHEARERDYIKVVRERDEARTERDRAVGKVAVLTAQLNACQAQLDEAVAAYDALVAHMREDPA
jgi:protein gp37